MPQRHKISYWMLCLGITLSITGQTAPQENASQQNADEQKAQEAIQTEQQTQTEQVTANDAQDEEQQTAEEATPEQSEVAGDELAQQEEPQEKTQQTANTAEQNQKQQEDTLAVGNTYYGEVSQEDLSAARENINEITQEQEADIVKLEKPISAAKRHEKRMYFQFEETPLHEIVQEFAKKRGMNIILPHGEDAITQKVSFKQDKPVSLSRAERYIYMLLDLAGYRMYPHGSYYIISKHQQDHQMRTPFPLYVNVPPRELPQTEADISVIYSLVNLRVPEKAGGGGPIDEVLRTTLSNQKAYTFDPLSNSIIITDSSENIAATMHIILSLDASDSPEILQTIQLYNSSAQNVAKLLNEQIITQTQGQRGKSQQRLSTSQYFAPNVHVVSDARRNRLLVLGRNETVKRITDFVREYLDAPQESGKSILHVYELQYLDAKEFAPILQKLVKPAGTKGEQAEKEGVTGPTRYFDDVKIIAEPEQQLEAKTAQEGTQQTKRLSLGGNRLVIAATSDDWERIKRIIADLDKPQKQVIIEVMIADVQATNQKSLGSQTRNPNVFDLPDDVTFQASHLSGGPILDNQQNPTTLMSDLLRLIDGQSFASNVIGENERGAMLLSIADPYDSNKIWSIFKVLDKYVERKVLSHPFLVTRDNVQAQAKNINIRRDTGGLAEGASQSVSPTVEIQDFEAKLVVNVTPRVSSQERLNMQIDIDIEDFLGETGFNRINRKITTNTNMQTGQVLVLGGLSRTNESTTHRQTPILGDLPIVGQFFRSQTKTYDRTNLVVFLTPTIVEPKLREGMHRYTNDKIEERYREAQGNVFETLHQPITHFFFGGAAEETAPLDSYLDEVNYKHQQQELPQDYIYHTEHEIMKGENNYEDTDALKNKFKETANPMAR